MEMYGLFGNDAMVLETMQRFNLKYFLSSDTDFDEINWIERIEAYREGGRMKSAFGDFICRQIVK